MQSPIDDTIKDQIIKYGTIALDALIEIIAPFLPPFVDKEDVRTISILLLSVITPTAVLGGAFVAASALSDVAIFGVKTATEITKFGAKAVYYTGKTTMNAVATTAVITTDLLIKKPLYLISYPFRSSGKKNYEGLFNAIAQREKNNNMEDLQHFQEMSKDSSKVFLVIRRIEAGSDKISLRMVGSLQPNE